MKKLNEEQLRSVGIYSVFGFCGSQWHIEFCPWKKHSYWYGWYLFHREANKDAFIQRGIERVSRWYHGNKNPLGMEELPAVLEKYGEKMPEAFIKVLGAWVPKDFYDKRMAELVALYKARQGERDEQ